MILYLLHITGNHALKNCFTLEMHVPCQNESFAF